MNTLTKCPACNHRVSVDANACPECGQRLTEKAPSSGGFGAKVLITFGVLVAIGGLVLQAAPYANVYHLLLARYLLWGGAIIGGIGVLALLWRR